MQFLLPLMMETIPIPSKKRGSVIVVAAAATERPSCDFLGIGSSGHHFTIDDVTVPAPPPPDKKIPLL